MGFYNVDREPEHRRPAQMLVVGSGPTSLLVIGAFVDACGGWENIRNGDIIIIGNNFHSTSPFARAPSEKVSEPTESPGMGRLGNYRTILSNTTINGFNNSIKMFKSLSEVVQKHNIQYLQPQCAEFDSIYDSFWEPDLYDRPCFIGRVADLFAAIYKCLIFDDKVIIHEGGVFDLIRDDGKDWVVEFVDTKGNIKWCMSERVFLCTGIVPKYHIPDEITHCLAECVNESLIQFLDVEVGMDRNLCNLKLPRTKCDILIIGYSHSAAVVAQNLYRLPDRWQRLFIYHRKAIGYAYRLGNGRVENDNTGLKQASAFFTKKFIDVRYRTVQETRATVLRSVEELRDDITSYHDPEMPLVVINCTGYQYQNQYHRLPRIERNGEEVELFHHNDQTGQLVVATDGADITGLYGYGPAFPKSVPASEFSKRYGHATDHDIGLFKTSKYLDLVKENWMA
eukprot:GHVH01000659.1.p1 GENE.GHVH01000659.1~~GHVH01000659.1.p1  ORF type:complete len:453 (-),score=41.65 GHVH01000659.1:980-2338(-)